jgi:hypothetical protein
VMKPTRPAMPRMPKRRARASCRKPIRSDGGRVEPDEGDRLPALNISRTFSGRNREQAKNRRPAMPAFVASGSNRLSRPGCARGTAPRSRA